MNWLASVELTCYALRLGLSGDTTFVLFSELLRPYSAKAGLTTTS
jgi:hypothetical protein